MTTTKMIAPPTPTVSQIKVVFPFHLFVGVGVMPTFHPESKLVQTLVYGKIR
ncbi:MAG: hypothetical protein ACXAAN_16675 [Candidatus Thorarchaeota archaeon]|jgi:hypothetical protein